MRRTADGRISLIDSLDLDFNTRGEEAERTERIAVELLADAAGVREGLTSTGTPPSSTPAWWLGWQRYPPRVLRTAAPAGRPPRLATRSTSHASRR